jgi:carbonic anhydrase
VAQRHIIKLMAGFKRFREVYFAEKHALYDKLSSTGQSPKTLIIGCSDSRVDPALLSSASPGDLFVIRNVANLVPPFESSGGFHGVSSAIEFAVVNLKVETIIVLGHRQCGGIRALVNPEITAPGSFVRKWMRIAESAKERVLQKYPGASQDELCAHCETEAILSSIENLKTFPFVQEAVNDRGLVLMGLYFDLERGELLEYDPADTTFKPIQV